MSVVYRKFDSQKTNIDSKCIKITHAILLPFHIKNHNQSNGHELKEKKNHTSCQPVMRIICHFLKGKFAHSK